MKLKIIILSFFAFIVFSLAPIVHAADIQVIGKVGNQNPGAYGSKLNFKNTATGNIFSTQVIDPTGNYMVMLPQGTYDVEIVPPANSGVAPVTIRNRNFESNTVSNINFPSDPALAQPKINLGNDRNFLYFAIAGLALLIIVVIIIFWQKKKN